MYIVKILDLITKNARYDKENALFKAFAEAFEKTQVWVWLFWIPQLLDLVLRSSNEYEIALLILTEIAKIYPQALFISLRLQYWYFQNKQDQSSEQKQKMTKLGKKVYPHINDPNASVTIKKVIDLVIKELQKKFIVTKEEELHNIIEKGHMMAYKEDYKPERYFERLWAEFFADEKDKPAFMSKTLKKQFIKDFMDNTGPEPKVISHPITYLQEKLKKWKDILSRRLNLKSSPQSLVDISENLANFNYRNGMELPGQYLEIETEPFPEKRVLITRFEPNVFQNNKKRIIIRTNTGKRLTYSILTNFKALEHATKTDERMTQFKVFLNKIFSYMHPETMRRGVKLGVFKKIIFPYTKL